MLVYPSDSNNCFLQKYPPSLMISSWPSPLFSCQSLLPLHASNKPHGQDENQPSLFWGKPHVSGNQQLMNMDRTGLFHSGYECLHHMPIQEYLAYKNFLGSPHRCLDPPHFTAFTKTWTTRSSNLFCSEIADAKCNPRTLMFDDDAIYPGVRTCSRGLGFLCPLVNPTCLYTF